MNKFNQLILISSLGLLGASACGSDGGGINLARDDAGPSADASGEAGADGGAHYHQHGDAGNVQGTDVADDLKLSQVTAAQAVALCKEFDSQSAIVANTINQGACAAAGLELEAQNQGKCEDLQKECLAQPQRQNEPESCDTAQADMPKCTNVTVGEFRACLDAYAKVADDLYGDLNCNSDPASLPTQQPETPAACRTLYERCPELQQDGSGSVDAGTTSSKQ